MSFKRGDMVYIYLRQDGVVEQCQIRDTNFFDENQYLLHGMSGRGEYVARADELYGSAEECLKCATEKRAAEYKRHYDELDSMEALFLHLLWSAIDSGKHDDMEIAAMIDRASECVGVNIGPAVEQYVKAMEQEKKAATESFEFSI